MHSRSCLASLLLVVLLPLATTAAEPDFYLVMKACKTAVGYLTHSNESLGVLDGDPATSACVRQSGSVSCALSFQGGDQGREGNLAQYEVLVDIPPMLLLSDEKGGEFVYINTTERAAVVVTRVAGLEYAGSKVCQGLYSTSLDLESLEE